MHEPAVVHREKASVANTVRIYSQSIAVIGLALLCSCATAPDGPAIIPASELPADVVMNKEAGRGMDLFVKLRLENGQEFMCAVDTGSPYSQLPKSTEPVLGKLLGTRRFSTLESSNEKENVYAAPKLYLGNTPLLTGSHIGTSDSPMGVLGMDCLRHYCIQLDFQAGKMRFLDSEHVNAAGLGKAFPLTASRYAVIHHGGLFEQKGNELLIDTGCFYDGMANSGLFQREFREQKAQPVPMLNGGVAAGFACFPKCRWDGETYANLIIRKGRPTLIGLRFLARHQVTFDFPKGILYLKRTSGDALRPAGSP